MFLGYNYIICFLIRSCLFINLILVSTVLVLLLGFLIMQCAFGLIGIVYFNLAFHNYNGLY